MRPRSVVITAPDITAAGYSGMGLRALGIAGALARHYRVTLLVAGVPQGMPDIDVQVVSAAHERRKVLRAADVIITSNALRVRELVGLQAAVVSDLYDPSYFEWLVLSPELRGERTAWTRRQLQALRRAVRTSDMLLCANQRQRDLYLGALLDGADLDGLVDPDATPLFTHRVVVVPNGVSPSEQLPERGAARARLGLATEDLVLLWGGGVWDWLDVDTVIQGVRAAHERNAAVKVIFLGLRRADDPDPHARRALDLLSPYVGAPEGSFVQVNERWVSPAERLDYLAAADAGILGQYDNLETHFSFRTRLIDCLQAGLPVLSMSGDELSDRAATEGWGLSSTMGDVMGLRDNILAFAEDAHRRADMQAAARRAAAMFTWEVGCAGLLSALERVSVPSRTERLRRTAILAPDLARSGSVRVQRRLGLRPEG